ncbi:MAG: hypothetical protein ABR555_04095 [Pyrinomonadaceae bacterium]
MQNSNRIQLWILITVVATAGMVMGQRTTQRVRFARGRTTAVLHGAAVRGTQNRYLIGARSGQAMTVHITSREKNAVFTILGPDATALPGTEEGVDAADWSGELPLSGDYAIWVGSTRGNTTYTLEITIR